MTSKPGANPADPAHGADSELATRLCTGEREAFDEFFHTYFQRLYRFCLKRVDTPELAEDLTQETLIKALKAMHSYRGEAALFTWLCQICRNEISSWGRRTGKKLAQLRSLDEEPEIIALLDETERRFSIDPSDATAREELVHLSLDALPASYGDVLEMKYVEGLSVEEIAQRLEQSITGVQSLLARARSAFRDTYSRLTAEVDAGTTAAAGNA